MQSGASKTLNPKASPTVSKTRGGPSARESSRVRGASGGDSVVAGSVGRTRIICDNKDVTPRPLVPAQYLKQGEAGSDVAAAKGATQNDEETRAAEEKQAQAPPQPLKPVKPAGLSREELDRNVDIILSETETVTLISFPSVCVDLNNPISSVVSARNKAYDELCAAKADSDQYKDQHAQTLNNPHKSKEVSAAPPSQENAEVCANGWDIYDTFATDPVPKHKQLQMACDKESAATVALAVKKPGCLFTMNEPYPSHDVPKEPSVQKEKGRRRGADGKSMQFGNSRGLSAGVSTMGAPASVAPGGVRAGVSGAAADAEGGSAPPATGSWVASGVQSPVPGILGADSAAAGEGATGGDDATKAAEAGDEARDGAADPPADAEIMPWKVGTETPIPDELAQAVKIMERIISQNVLHKQHMIYRNYPTLEELAKLDELRAAGAAGGSSTFDAADAEGERPLGAGVLTGDAIAGEGVDGVTDGAVVGDGAYSDAGVSSGKPALQDLFCFEAPQLTQSTTVTCAEWNSYNQDLLAVSYGDTAPVPTEPGGLVLFWSLKNPTYPERVIRTRHGVTALHFSSVHPNMVAAGAHDGSVLIWDLRRPSDQPVLRSGSSTSTQNDQKHTDIVWETRWVDQGPDKQPPEVLVSVSSDGNVLQWSMKKGLEQTTLMQLKRLPNKQLGSNSVYGHKEGIVFRKSSGFCIDFPRHDPSSYMVGTEDGLVHRCSTSYNEQYLETYYGHSGPVYRVRCNPFLSHAFLTCSADWTMRLWTTKPVPGHQGDTPLLTFQSTDLNDAVNDVVWAPNNSTSFAAAMDDGRVELWDLSEKPLDPIVVHFPQMHETQRRRTCVRFSPNSPVLVAGDDKGSVVVMRMYNTNQSYYSDQEQQERLNAVMVKKR